jgi:hypothetical protein
MCLVKVVEWFGSLVGWRNRVGRPASQEGNDAAVGFISAQSPDLPIFSPAGMFRAE